MDFAQCTCDRYQRKAIRGFEWLGEKALRNNKQLMSSSDFKNFKILDMKKKWKKKNTKTFQGLEERIEKVIKANPKIKQDNTRQYKHSLFVKSIEEIHCRNELKKINKVKGAYKICEKQKSLKRKTIQSYFQKEAEDINLKFLKYGSSQIEVEKLLKPEE